MPNSAEEEEYVLLPKLIFVSYRVTDKTHNFLLLILPFDRTLSDREGIQKWLLCGMRQTFKSDS
jgi:hypothetical protein